MRMLAVRFCWLLAAALLLGTVAPAVLAAPTPGDSSKPRVETPAEKLRKRGLSLSPNSARMAS